jgi:tRNA A37 threonylcarbamoyladenosine modification protein TsaB
MDAKEQTLYLGLFKRGTTGSLELECPAKLLSLHDLPNVLPRPIMLIGEALWHQKVAGVALGPEELYLPKPQGVWQVGRRMAKDGQFQDLHTVLPLYLRQPEAVRLWEKQGKP